MKDIYILQMNPQHNIPTLKDGDFVTNESKAIVGYIAGKYDKTGNLYPDDPKTRAMIDQRLYFHGGTFDERCGKVMVS
jgi:glutathione S-transferase